MSRRKTRYTLTPRLQCYLIEHCVGRWVAVTFYRVIAVGDSSTEVYEAARVKGFELPIIYRVPEPDTAHFYFAA